MLECRAFESAARRNRDLWKERAIANADRRIGLRKRSFSGRHIRTSLRKLRRDPGGYRRRRIEHWFHRNRKIGGHFAHQHRDRVFILRAGEADIDRRRLRRFQRCSRLDNGNVVSRTCVIRTLRGI